MGNPRLRELALRVTNRLGFHGMDHLCAVLFTIDMEAYGRLGHSITGARWIRVPTGVRPR